MEIMTNKIQCSRIYSAYAKESIEFFRTDVKSINFICHIVSSISAGGKLFS